MFVAVSQHERHGHLLLHFLQSSGIQMSFLETCGLLKAARSAHCCGLILNMESIMTNNQTNDSGQQDVDLITDALEKAGKGADEIESVMTVDAAQVAADSERSLRGVVQEALLSTSPLDLELFACIGDHAELSTSEAARVLDRSIEITAGHVSSGTMLGENGKISSALVSELAAAGYWGLPIAPEWGGSGASKFFLGRAIVRMGSQGFEIAGGLLSIERLIGASGPLSWKGTDEQKERILTRLASGELRSGFAATEPCVGCNITKVRTHGIVDGDNVVVYGDKLFISNAWYGHVVALFLRIDDKLRVLVVELPTEDSEEFQVVHYPIHALKQIHNKGLRFNGLRVPLKNLLPGDGLSVIFHDLDDGRFAVAATAAARMRKILASGVPWVKFRKTFGEKLEKREYIRYLLALQAAYIAGADALIDWSASLIDGGFQGDVSSMIAKTKATDWLVRCSTELGKFTHGGRFVLVGHTIGDLVVDDLVARVYEGPNPMLGKACIKSLAKAFGEELLVPIIKALARSGVELRQLRFHNGKAIRQTLSYLWKNRSALLSDRKFLLEQSRAISRYMRKLRWSGKIDIAASGVDSRFSGHLRFAEKAWNRWRRDFFAQVMLRQERLADEDLIMLEQLYEPLTDIVSMLCAVAASRPAIASGDRGTVAALNMLCLELRCKIGGEKRFSTVYKKAVHETAELVLSGQFHQLDGVSPGTLLQPYDEAEQPSEVRTAGALE